MFGNVRVALGRFRKLLLPPPPHNETKIRRYSFQICPAWIYRVHKEACDRSVWWLALFSSPYQKHPTWYHTYPDLPPSNRTLRAGALVFALAACWLSPLSLACTLQSLLYKSPVFDQEDLPHSLDLGTKQIHAMNVFVRLLCSLIAAAHVSAGGSDFGGLYHLTESIVGREFYDHFNWEAIEDPTHGRVSVACLPHN